MRMVWTQSSVRDRYVSLTDKPSLKHLELCIFVLFMYLFSACVLWVHPILCYVPLCLFPLFVLEVMFLCYEGTRCRLHLVCRLIATTTLREGTATFLHACQQNNSLPWLVSFCFTGGIAMQACLAWTQILMILPPSACIKGMGNHNWQIVYHFTWSVWCVYFILSCVLKLCFHSRHGGICLQFSNWEAELGRLQQVLDDFDSHRHSQSR